MNIEACTVHVTDPRQSKNQQYSLSSLLLIVFASAISGYDTPDEMVEFVKLKLDWFRKYVDLKRAPCAETLRHFIVCIQPDELIKGFEAFVQAEFRTDQEVIAMDGKTMRGTGRAGYKALHVLSAWSTGQGITLGALACEEKSNEITAIPRLLERINVEGATVTLDAMGCQRGIAEKIRARKGDYVLQIKKNQGALFNEIQAYHHKLARDGYQDLEHDTFEEADKGHGRVEIRRTEQFALSNWVESARPWKDARSVIRIERERHTANGHSSEVAWYLSSRPVHAKHAAKAVRSHWEVESVPQAHKLAG